jgi:hypothetical protein
MIDYKKMYALLCGAASDSLDILESSSDEQAILSVKFLLQQAMIRAEHIYTVTASGEYEAEGEHE